MFVGRNGIAQFCHLFVGEGSFPEGDLGEVGDVAFLVVLVAKHIEAEGLHDVACVFVAFCNLLAVEVDACLAAFVVCVVSEHDAIPLVSLDFAGILNGADTHLTLIDEEVAVVGVSLVHLEQAVEWLRVGHHDVHEDGVGC